MVSLEQIKSYAEEIFSRNERVISANEDKNIAWLMGNNQRSDTTITRIGQGITELKRGNDLSESLEKAKTPEEINNILNEVNTIYPQIFVDEINEIKIEAESKISQLVEQATTTKELEQIKTMQLSPIAKARVTRQAFLQKREIVTTKSFNELTKSDVEDFGISYIAGNWGVSVDEARKLKYG